MSPKEWGELPWYESVALLTGLKSQGIIGGGDQQVTRTPRSARSGATPVPVDLTEPGATLGLGGFSTRRAG